MNPLTNKSDEAPTIPEVKTQPKQEKTTSISHKVFEVMLQELREKEDDSLIEQMGEEIANKMCPIPANSSFADTDMVVFKDDYRGYLPPNGIRESELNETTKLYQEISNRNTRINIERKNGQYLNITRQNDEFENKILLCIKTLLTRGIGRKLINSCLKLGVPIHIISGKTTETMFNEVRIDLSEKGDPIRQHPSGKLTYQASPLFLTLGHELIHVIHNQTQGLGAILQPSLLDHEGAKYDTLEEQTTITGFKKGLKATDSKEGDWSPIVHEYDDLNERTLTAAFTGSLTEYWSQDEKIRFPRMGHHAVDPQLPLGYFLKKLVKENVLYDLEKQIKEKSITKETLNSMFSPGELHILAIENGHADTLKMLLKIDSNPITDQDDALLHLVAKKGKKLELETRHKLIDAILETPIDVNLPDLQGYTPLHYFTKQNDITTVQKIVKKGGKIHQKNEVLKPEDPADFALSSILKASKNHTDIKSRLHDLYQLMKTVYPKNEFIQKMIEPNFAKKFLCYGDEESILDCLDMLHESGYDLSKLDSDGNSIIHYATLSHQPAVINKLKNQFKLDLNIENANKQAPSDYLINQLPNYFIFEMPYTNKDWESVYDEFHASFQALGADIDQHKKALLLISKKIEGSTYFLKLFDINPLSENQS